MKVIFELNVNELNNLLRKSYKAKSLIIKEVVTDDLKRIKVDVGGLMTIWGEYITKEEVTK